MTTPADIAAAVLAEREACARACDGVASAWAFHSVAPSAANACRDAIRTRPAPGAEAPPMTGDPAVEAAWEAEVREKAAGHSMFPRHDSDGEVALRYAQQVFADGFYARALADRFAAQQAPTTAALERALSEAYAQGVIDGQAAIAAGKAAL